MGMYTELLLKCKLKDGLGSDVKDVLEFLFGAGAQPKKSPDHNFFRCAYWPYVGKSSSYYHHPKALSNLTDGYLFTRSDFKNYTDEIDLFLAWLYPFIDSTLGECMGWVWYEEWDEPSLLYYGRKGVSQGIMI